MQLQNVAVVVPAYEPSTAFVSFVKSLRAEFATVVVVDDGSGDEFAATFDSVRDLGATVLQQTPNRGKGRALKTAFAHLEPYGVDVVTVDSDGQHIVEDVLTVTERMEENRREGKVATVLGVRDFSLEGIPWRSRFGNKFTSALVWVLFGRYLQDTQTGLRGIPADQLASLQKVRGERFDYEMDALLQSLTVKQPIQELPITTIYHDIGNSQSHYRPVRDSIQVYLQIARFASSSLIGSLVDLAVYAAIVDLAFSGRADAEGIVLAVVVARLISSAVNFAVNRSLVFRDMSPLRRTVCRYYTLAAGLLAVSVAGTVLFAQLFNGHLVWAKVLVDTVLFGVSLVLQKRWVFVDHSLESPS